MRSLSSKSRLDKDVIYDLKWIHKHYYLYNVNGGPPVLMPPLQEALAMNGLAPGQPIIRALAEKPDTALMNPQVTFIECGYSLYWPEVRLYSVTWLGG